MNLGDMLQPVLIILSGCGGIAGIIAAVGWSRAVNIRAHGKVQTTPIVRDDAVLAEMKALKAQVQELQSTGHQFDISFDAALSRLEDHVNRVETKSAAASAVNEETRQRIGIG